MHLKLACLAVGVGLMALPASAQAYADPCRAEQRANTGAGAVIGGIIGGVLGSNIAAPGHRGDGTALGAAVGALAGGAAGHGTRDCPVYGPAYPASAYPAGGPYDRRGEPGRYGPGGYDRYGYEPYPQEEPRIAERDSMPEPDLDGRRLDDPDDDDYNAASKDEVRECRPVRQRTRLPDGTEVTRRVEACRSARYGEWTLQD